MCLQKVTAIEKIPNSSIRSELKDDFMRFRTVNLIFILFTLMSCTQFPYRTYTEEMEEEDYSFFNPREDFPVVSGDNGRDWISEGDRIRRTPASDVFMAEEKSKRALRSELRELEYMQSDDDMDFYNAHKDKFGSASEKIFFLNLPVEERRDYLVDRGFLAPLPSKQRKSMSAQSEKVSVSNHDSSSSFSGFNDPFIVRSNDVTLGMNKSDVLESMGRPLQVEIAGNPRNENERWLYELNGASKYIYFEAGEVQGWE